MRRIALTTVAALAAAALSVVPGGPPASAQPAPVARQSLVVEPLGGHDIYTHTTGTDYRIGPALMRSTGSIVYQYTCGPAPTGPGQVIRKATSYNGGTTWSSETVVLQATTNVPSGDSQGVCDPAIVKDGNYFYLAYTGLHNNTPQLFVARAGNPGGPFTKWNGTDWTGGGAAPLIKRDTIATGPSLVNRAGTIHLFYNTRITTGPAAGSYQTRHANATLGGDPNTWPARLTADPGVAIGHPGKYTGTDCVGSHWWADTDVKYDETTGKYLAITSDQATYRWSALQAYESTDGTTFTRAIITRGDYQPGARNPGQLADPYGHLTPNATKAIGYAHSTTCGQADLRYTTTKQHNLTTGAITQTFFETARDWYRDSGTWSIAPVGYFQQTQTAAGQVYESTLATGAAAASATISVEVRGSATQSKRVGLHFAKAHPGDTTDQSGYTAYLETTDGNQGRLCLVKAGSGNLACTNIDNLGWTSWTKLTVIQSGSAIKAYINDNSAGGVSVTDADHPYLGGYLGLTTWGGTGNFRNLTVGDNMPTYGTQDDWVPRAGDGRWEFHDSGIYNGSVFGQLNLRTMTTQGVTRDVQLGDGTYTADIHLPFADYPDDWGGLALTNDAITRSWSSGGYVVFLRTDGNLAISKAGTGQVVADVPTGTDPWRYFYRIRVVKTGPNFQVYVEDQPDPLINWTDTNAPAWGIGGFGVANDSTYITIRELTYAGNDAH